VFNLVLAVALFWGVVVSETGATDTRRGGQGTCFTGRLCRGDETVINDKSRRPGPTLLLIVRRWGKSKSVRKTDDRKRQASYC
jgi:hypothetical protein